MLLDPLKKHVNMLITWIFIIVSAVFINNSGSLDDLRVEIAVAARPQPMKL
jgi:hypothetical protein